MALSDTKNRISFIGFLLGVLVILVILVFGSPLPLPSIGKHIDADAHIKLLFVLFVIVIILMAFLLKKKIHINRFLFFIFLPYALSILSWVITNYIPNIDLYRNLPTLTGQVGVIFITQYLIYGIWIIPLVGFISTSVLSRFSPH